MKIRIAFGIIAMVFILALPVNAGGKSELQKYFSSTAARVKATDNPTEKREILNRSFSDMSKALGIAENLPLVSEKDRNGIENFKAKLQEKQDELAGSNGFVRVQDKQLNSFSDYVVQDTEQAEMITISLVALLLIILIVLLIV